MTTTEPRPDLDRPIPLPEVRSSGRRRRRERERAGGVGLALLVGAAAISVLAWLVLGWWGGGSDSSPSDGRPQSGAGSTAPSARPILLAVKDSVGDAQLLAIVVPPEPERRGTVLLLPPGTMSEQGGLGPQPIARALRGGSDQLRSSVENLLGVRLRDVSILDEAELADAIEPSAPLIVDVPKRIERIGDNGVVEVLFEAGRQTLDASQAARYLIARGDETELDRLALQQPLWESWVDASEKASDPSDPLTKTLTRLAAGEWSVRALPVRSFGSSPQQGEMYTIDSAGLARTVREVFGSQTAERPRVRILNGTGALGLAARVEKSLLPSQVQVVLTGNADRLDHAETLIIFHNPAARKAASQVRDSLGVGTLVHNRNLTEVVDVTIIVGRDFET